MIFILHYFLFNAGLSATTILLALFLQTYSDASLTEIGALLMVLPFVSILVKPLFCALADRQQAHKQYAIGSLALMMLGYGSLIVAPFYPEFIKQHGRLVWYLDVVAIVVGYSAFGVIWSLGDALAVNAARIRGVPWGSYRVWATFSWGVFGWLIGQVNETPALPKYVPGFLVLIGSLLIEIVLFCAWPNKTFDMSEADQVVIDDALDGKPAAHQAGSTDDLEMNDAHWPSNRSLTGTLSAGSCRLNPRLMGAVANIFMEDIGSSLKNSLKIGQPPKRMGLQDILEQHQLSAPVGLAHPPLFTRQSLHGSPSASVRRMQQQQLQQQHSLSDFETPQLAGSQPGSQHRPAMIMSSLASNTSLGRAAAARAALGFVHSPSLAGTTKDSSSPDVVGGSHHTDDHDISGGLHTNGVHNESQQSSAAATVRPVEDLQLVLLKLIVKRDAGIFKYLIMFTLFGVLLFVHITYFFLHVEQLCREKGYDFSSVTGAMLVAQSASEIFSFIVVAPYCMPRLGRLGSMLSCALIFATRYAFYGTYYSQLSPYTALATEICHGFAYAITYTLITDIATECVDQVDVYLPELIQRRIVDPQINPNELKLPLRATMQGVFSGAFDGLGNGIGALFAGIYLDSYSYASLWLICTYISVAIAVIYPLTEWRSFRAGTSATRRSLSHVQK